MSSKEENSMTEQLQSLDFQLIERASEKYENIKEAIINMEVDGEVQPFIVEIYKHFSPVQVKMCVQEFVEKLHHVRTHDKSGFEGVVMPYMMFLIIKHFTTLKLPNRFAEQLVAIEHMTNTGTMFQIFMYMDENEVNKVKQEVGFVVENFESNLEETKDFQNQIRSMLTDKSLME
jgi:uncharacterized protein (UPF0297 family)